ncbi:MAG: hypothetical protein GXO62_06790 [Epsilonproteobacteria bacterium]|nr:hypothetical protein [Campylobacterota bacterium]
MTFIIDVREDPVYIEGKTESAIEMIKKFNLPLEEVCNILDIDKKRVSKALGESNES